MNSLLIRYLVVILHEICLRDQIERFIDFLFCVLEVVLDISGDERWHDLVELSVHLEVRHYSLQPLQLSHPLAACF